MKSSSEPPQHEEPKDSTSPSSESSTAVVPATTTTGSLQAAMQRLGIRHPQDNNNNNNNNDDNLDEDSSMETMRSSFQRLLTIISSLQYDVTTRLNHYSIVPTDLQELYDAMHQHATIIHTTVTKYTLMQQMVVRSNTDKKNSHDKSVTADSHIAIAAITKELLHSCRILVASTIALYTNDDDDHHLKTNAIGASQSLCHHTKTAIHKIIHSVVQLLQVFPSSTTGSNGSDNNNNNNNMDPAQYTGVVWEACQTIIGDTTKNTTTTTHQNNKSRNMISTIPLGNRNAIRRDIFNYKLECQDTIQEFELLLQQSQNRIRTVNTNLNSNNNNNKKKRYDDSSDDDDDDEEDDEDEFYTTLQEINIVTPCVALLKCSRGALNITLNMIDHIGLSIVIPDNNNKNNNNNLKNKNHQQHSKETRLKYFWIQHLCQEMTTIGRGLTELGATLYPPLLDENYTALVGIELIKQSCAIQDLLHYMLEEIVASNIPSLTIPQATIDLIDSVLTACKKRTDEAMEAID
jgi:Grap2 and cyclin-D-interacting